MSRPRIVTMTFTTWMLACASPPLRASATSALTRVDATEPQAVTTITVVPTSAWMDTGIAVHRGERLTLTSTGEIFWERQHETVGPNGRKGVPGWSVGRGGLIARVGAGGKPFDVGARTERLVAPRDARPPRRVRSIPPITIPQDGTLQLGFKAFTSGANTGAFVVAVAPASAPSP